MSTQNSVEKNDAALLNAIESGDGGENDNDTETSARPKMNAMMKKKMSVDN